MSYRPVYTQDAGNIFRCVGCGVTQGEIHLRDCSEVAKMSKVRLVDPPDQPGHKGQKLARFDLLPWDALWAVAEHYGKGAEKYAARNWERGYEYSKLVAQIGRHLAQIATGELIDPENGSPHAAAIAFGALALIAFEARGIGDNDLPQLDVHLESELTNPEDIGAARKEVESA